MTAITMTLPSAEPTHPSNHNGGPPLVDDPVAVAFAKIDDLYGEAKNFADGEPIASQEMHDAIEVLHKSLHEAGKEAEDLRVAAKKPLDDAVDALQAKFNPYVQPKKGRVALGKEALGALLAAWRKKVADEKAAAAAKAAREAEEDRRIANEAMRASSGNLEARERAEELLSTAKESEKYARRQDKAATTGTGLRTVWTATLTDQVAALEWAWNYDGGAFEALTVELARGAVRAGLHTIPGFEVREEKVATV